MDHDDDCFEPELASADLADAVGLNARDRRALRRLHLIESDTGGSWRMHRLTRELGRHAGSEDELDAAQSAFVVGCLELSRGIDLTTGFRLYLPNRTHRRGRPSTRGQWPRQIHTRHILRRDRGYTRPHG